MTRVLINYSFRTQGEFAVKLEIEQMSATDKGVYKLVARNEKGEATSQVVEVTEIPDQGEKPKIVTGLKSIVSIFTSALFD